MGPCRMTLDEWLDIWLRDYRTGVKPSTAYLYQRQAKLYIRPAACILPKIIKKEIHPMDDRDTARFLEAIKGSRYELPLKVDLVTDLRTAAAGRGGKDGYQRHYTVGL